MPSYLPYVYAPYAAVAVLLTIFLAHTLSKNGAVFLDAIFPDSPQMATAVNRLLVVGFYLVNLGWALVTLTAKPPVDPSSAMEILATKLGTLMLVLAGMHFLNLIVFHKIRQNALER